ncbi:hypothetical protein JKP88DRAFT_240986 [Tribonema minus]|uniref:Uncharacterized protein n=1 Tax=Tribonema minus TaxID=303371 RepID=A0A836CID9_9STRA|nr:hypothetical protein JKP88DRAFT_240986 [Tribonema minus]
MAAALNAWTACRAPYYEADLAVVERIHFHKLGNKRPATGPHVHQVALCTEQSAVSSRSRPRRCERLSSRDDPPEICGEPGPPHSPHRAAVTPRRLATAGHVRAWQSAADVTERRNTRTGAGRCCSPYDQPGHSAGLCHKKRCKQLWPTALGLRIWAWRQWRRTIRQSACSPTWLAMLKAQQHKNTELGRRALATVMAAVVEPAGQESKVSNVQYAQHLGINDTSVAEARLRRAATFQAAAELVSPPDAHTAGRYLYQLRQPWSDKLCKAMVKVIDDPPLPLTTGHLCTVRCCVQGPFAAGEWQNQMCKLPPRATLHKWHVQVAFSTSTDS